MREQSKDNDMPTVAHINNSFFEGSETFIYQYISHLSRFKPICIASKYLNLDQFPFPEEDMYSISTVQYSPKWYCQKVNHRFLNREPLLTRQLKRLDCSLVHAHFGHNGCLAVSTKKRLHLPLVTTFYGFDVSARTYVEQYRKRYNLLFKEGELFLIEGPHMRERLVELGCPPEKLKIQHIAIPVGEIPFRARQPKLEGEKKVLLFAGRFVEKKGLTYLIRAIARVNLERRDFELRLIGNGPLEEETRALVDSNKLSDRTVFLGFLPYKKYLEEIGRADILINPSITAANGDSEGGAPTVILEAQASGLPILTTDHADIPNIVMPEKSAILCPERNEEALAANLIYLLEEQYKWEGMGLAGRSFVEANHDIEKEVDTLEERYSSLL